MTRSDSPARVTPSPRPEGLPGARAPHACEARAEYLRAALLLGAAAAVIYFPLLVPGRAPYSPVSDVVAFHVGLKDVLWRALSSGELPLWRSDQMLGGPALTQPQALYLHPLQVLYWLFEPHNAVGPSFVLSLWVGALGAYALARSLETSRAAALVAGAAQLVSFKWIAAGYAGWSSPLATLVMLPWLCKAVVDCAHRPSLGVLLTSSLSCAVAFAGGSPQTLYYALLILSALPLVASRAGPARSYGCLAAALCLGIGCSAYLWLPLLVDLPLLARAEQGYDFFLSGHALGLEDLATLLHPELLGTPLDGSYARVELWEDVAYFGLVPLLLSAVALARFAGASRSVRYFALALGLSLVLSLHSPLLRGLHALLPGYALFRLPARMLFVSAVLGVALAAPGLDALSSWLRPRAAGWARALPVALAALILLEGAHHARRYLGTVDAALLRADPHHPAAGLGREAGLRVAALGRDALNYGWASGLGVELVNGYDPYLFAHVRDYVTLVSHGTLAARRPGNWLDLKTVERWDLLRELSVGHALSALPRHAPMLRERAVVDGVRNFRLYRGMSRTRLHVYALLDPLPRVRFATRTLELPTLGAMADWLQQHSPDGAGLVLAAPAQAERGPPAPGDRVETLTRRPGAVRARVHSGRPRLLLLSEAFHPGWQARVDGRQVPVQQANLALLGVFVPAGTHELVLSFVPPGLVAGAAISGLGLLALLALGWQCARRARAHGPAHAPSRQAHA